MRAGMMALLAFVVACGTSDDGDDEQGGGVITYTVDGTEYVESAAVFPGVQPNFFAITWNSTGGGDLGDGFYGSVTLSAYTGPGTYAPMKRYSDVDAVIEVEDVTYYPLANGGEGDGSLVVETEDGVTATGSFSFTGDLISQDAPVAISGTFDVTLPTVTDED